jgi:TonB family protein
VFWDSDEGVAVSETALFSVLPKWQKPWYELALSYGVQALAIAVLIWVPILNPEIIDPPHRDYHAIELVPTPVPENHAPQRRLPPPPVVLAKLDPPPAALRLPAPEPRPKPKVEDTPVPEVKIVEKKPDLPTSNVPALPKHVVATNLFSTGSSAPQTVNRPATQVQTGGFGDPNGVPAKASQTQAVNIAQSGGFDLPTGPGYGNGTGGAKGVRGVVASTGFGSGVAVQDGRSASRGTVQQAGFGNADVPAPTTVQAKAAVPAPAKIIPAEILSKPVPIYTDEARQQKIEGEVLLEVTFEATGRIHVVRVVRGLGHGLDDAAVRAAEKIQFKPALKDGQPSDSTAFVHIVFQLA